MQGLSLLLLLLPHFSVRIYLHAHGKSSMLLINPTFIMWRIKRLQSRLLYHIQNAFTCKFLASIHPPQRCIGERHRKQQHKPLDKKKPIILQLWESILPHIHLGFVPIILRSMQPERLDAVGGDRRDSSQPLTSITHINWPS
jgi:hypothetical protein